MIFRLFAASLLSASLVAFPAKAETHTPAAALALQAALDPWPFAASDLPLDPDFRFGVLENGMRYIIRPNATPAAQGMVQFWVGTGSVAERDGEQGFAHFVEHMAFNGSTNVPEGEMVKLLEREGLAFGADTNASTGFDVTLYMLDLPRNDPALLDTALMLMRETASELLFEPDAVDREKGVILSERRVRDTYALRNTVDNLQFLYPQAHFTSRLPIGTIESLQAATAAGLKDFWQRHYRPTNTALIVVGDFDAGAVEAAIQRHFASWAAQDPAPQVDFGPVDPAYAGATAIYIDPALSERIIAARSGPWISQPDTAQNRRERVLRQIGYGIVNRRLQRLSRVDDPPFRGAGFGTSEVFKVGRTSNLIVDAAEGEWGRGLAAAQDELRRALQYGFTPSEVAEQVANLRSAIENNAAGAETRNNRNFITSAITLLEDGQIPTTPASALERFNAHEPEITPAAVLAALLEEVVELSDPLLRFEGRSAPGGGADAIRRAWNEGMARVVEAETDLALAEFAYIDFGPSGVVVADTVEPLLGIRTISFANGLRLNLMPTDLEQDRITLQLNIDGGQMLDTQADPLATAMTSTLASGGLGEHSIDELQSILAGKQLSFSFSAAAETFRMGGTTTPADLEMQLQLFAAALVDAGYRPQGEVQYRRNITNFFARLNATPESALSNALGTIISDNDPRFSLQDEEAYLALSFARLRDAIDERLKNGALELAIVGDVDAATAIALVARTLGALPEREPDFRSYTENRNRSFTADRSARTITHEGAPDQALLRMVWPTRDDSDPQENITLGLLERVMRLQLIDKLREELGQTYSPGASASQSNIYPDYGTFSLSAAVDVEDVGPARAAMLETVEALIGAPMSEDVILRARQPLLEAYDNALKTNNSWMNFVMRAQSRPDRIERFTRGKDILQTITAEDVQAMAARYLDPAQRLEIVALPAAQEPAEGG